MKVVINTVLTALDRNHSVKYSPLSTWEFIGQIYSVVRSVLSIAERYRNYGRKLAAKTATVYYKALLGAGW